MTQRLLDSPLTGPFATRAPARRPARPLLERVVDAVRGRWPDRPAQLCGPTLRDLDPGLHRALTRLRADRDRLDPTLRALFY